MSQQVHRLQQYHGQLRELTADVAADLYGLDLAGLL